MKKEEILEQLKTIVKNYLLEEIKVEDVTEDADLIEDLKINSAHIVDIIIDVEETFDIMIDDDSVANMKTLNDTIDIIQNKLSQVG